MNIFIIVIQFFLAGMFLLVGVMKLMKGKVGLAPKMGWVNNFSDKQVRGIGVLEILGAVGLVAPFLTGIFPILTSVAALGFVFLMLGAVVTHRRRNERGEVMATTILLVLSVIVMVGRVLLG